jgi:hypothetical protein
MDGSQFDVWTRRRFGLAAGGLSASLVGFIGLDSAEAKKKHKKKKKKKCKKLGETCTPDGTACCDCLACGASSGSAGDVCCQPGGAACTLAAQNDCCSGQCVGDFCFCKSNGNPCSEDSQCCSFNCASFQCAPAA